MSEAAPAIKTLLEDILSRLYAKYVVNCHGDSGDGICVGQRESLMIILCTLTIGRCFVHHLIRRR